MSAWRRFVPRVVALLRKDALDREFDDEARSHLELAIDDLLQQGLPAAEAERVARARFGLMAASKDAHRDARSLGWLDALLFDVVQAARALRCARGFSLTSIATLTIALALNASIFVVMDAVLFRGYPMVKANDRILFMQEHGPSGACCLSYLDFQDWQAQARSFQAMGFVRGRSVTFRDGDGRPMDMRASEISANTFSLLGVAPVLGRDFVAGDSQAGATPVVILSHRFWQSRFQGRGDIVGRTIRVGDRPATIVGVMPERFEFPLPIEGSFWTPVIDGPDLRKRGLAGGGFMAVGRLRDGVTKEEARLELESINRRLEADYPDTNRNVVAAIVTHSIMNSGPDAPMIWGSLWVASCLVLVIACANLANLGLVRTIGRWGEFATRLALGAGPARMVRQLIIEGLILGGMATVLAWWLVIWTVRAWATITFSQYQVLDYSVNAGAGLYLAGVACVSVILISIAPVLRVMQAGGRTVLDARQRGVTAGPRGRRLGDALIALQMALAIVLLSGAGVLMRSFTHIVGADTGVREPDRVLMGLMRMPSVDFADIEARRRYLDRLQEAINTAPGVEQVALASTSPARFAATRLVEFEGRARHPDDELIGFVRASAGYFSLLGARIDVGRAFRDDDRLSALPVAIVNQSFAERYWPGQDPIGKRIRWIAGTLTGDWRVVVGVTSNIMQNDPVRQTFRPLVYLPFAQEQSGLTAFWFAKSAGSAAQIAPDVRRVVEAVDGSVQLETFGSVTASLAFDRDFMDLEHSELGKHAKVAPVFAGIALILSAIGLIAVIGYSVNQRTKEIGIRMAIGATPRDVRRMILRDGLRPVAAGVVSGIALSLAANQVLRAQLVAVSPSDPVVFTAAPATLFLVAVLASQLPVRRAMAVDPVTALRAD